MDDHSIPFGRANLLAIPIGLVAFASLIGPFVLIWGRDDLRHLLRNDRLQIATALVIGLVIHEFLHGIGWKCAGCLSWHDFKFGIKWRTLTPYAYCSRQMTASAYRIGLMLPAVVLGIVPGIIGVASGQAALALFGAVLNGAAGLDYLVLWAMRGVPSHVEVIDSPDKIGCVIRGVDWLHNNRF